MSWRWKGRAISLKPRRVVKLADQGETHTKERREVTWGGILGFRKLPSFSFSSFFPSSSNQTTDQKEGRNLFPSLIVLHFPSSFFLSLLESKQSLNTLTVVTESGQPRVVVPGPETGPLPISLLDRDKTPL